MMAHRLLRGLAWLATFSVTALAFAQDLTFSAKADKTTLDLGEALTLTMTLSGDVEGVELPPLEFPEGFVVAARSQATNFALRTGAMERSLSLVYALVPQQAGTFKLGPFTIRHQQREFQTEAIEVTVNKPALPPGLKQRPDSGERFTL
jgi:hypothetical protein